jgi:hypothetical protein
LDIGPGAQHALGTSSGMQPCAECAITTPMRNSALACLDHIHSFGSAALALGSGARLTGMCKRDTTLAGVDVGTSQCSPYRTKSNQPCLPCLTLCTKHGKAGTQYRAPTLVLAAASTSHEQPLLGRQARSPPGPSGRLVPHLAGSIARRKAKQPCRYAHGRHRTTVAAKLPYLGNDTYCLTLFSPVSHMAADWPAGEVPAVAAPFHCLRPQRSCNSSPPSAQTLPGTVFFDQDTLSVCILQPAQNRFPIPHRSHTHQ